MPVSTSLLRPREIPLDRVLENVPLPNGGVRREIYDYAHRLREVQDPEGRRLHLNYNASGALTEVRDGAGVVASYSGRTARTARTETTIEADASGRPKTIVQRVDGCTWVLAFAWDDDRLASLTYPGSDNPLQFVRGEHAVVVTCGSETHATVRNVGDNTTETTFSNGAITLETVSPQMRRFTHFDRDHIARFDLACECDKNGRIVRAGEETYEYDAQDRLIWERRNPAARQHELDACGRRIATFDSLGRTRYKYDAYGQLAEIELAQGGAIKHIYDGFGRLVARESAGSLTYYVHDLQGRRLIEAAEDGRVRHSYVWLGNQCVARIDGPIDAPIAQTYHRAHAGKLLAIGDRHGVLIAQPCSDPWGADAPVCDGVPGYANLFGDTVTGLLHAGSRWLDPQERAFLTPDSWFGRDISKNFPARLRPVLRSIPGGPLRELTADNAYLWCAGDPVNFVDPNGHTWYGIILSFISAFMWEMQLTSISLQMEVLNILLDVLQVVPLFRPAWDTDGYWKTSIYNGNLPMTSGRLNVPFAIPLNGLLRFNDRGWTLGNVIWVRGDKWRSVDRAGKRDLLLCANANTYTASTDEAAADSYTARNPFAKATATGAGAQVTGVAITQPAGAAINDVFNVNDWISIRKPGDATDEIRQITNIAGGTFDLLAPALPASYAVAVEVTRLDAAIAKISKDDSLIARTITFIRGTAIHFALQIPEGFPLDHVAVTEFLPSGKRNHVQVDANKEYAVIRMATTGDRGSYAANDFVRIRSGSKYFPRTIGRTRGSRDLILPEPLPNPTAPDTYQDIEVVKLDAAGAAVAGQSANADKVRVGNLVDLQKFDGLTIDDASAPPVTLRRIVLQVDLECSFAAVDGALQNVPVKVHQMNLDASKQADGSNTAADVITTTAGQAGRFDSDQWVRIRKNPATDAFTKVKNVNKDANTITLKDPLPAADFPNGTAVTVTLLAEGREFQPENIPGTGDRVVLKGNPNGVVADDLLRITLSSNSDTAVVRKISAAPVVIATVDSAMPPSHTANLSVRRFTPVAATLHRGAKAPQVQIRFTVHGAAPIPFANGDTVFLQAGEEAFGTLVAAPVGRDFFLTDPIEYLLDPVAEVVSVTPTGNSTADGSIDESKILIPSDPDKDPITHREAFEQHEMRHVFQGALWGPFLLSLPLPWLFNLGFSFTDMANSASDITRHFGVGIIDTLVALAVVGIGEKAHFGPQSADAAGQLQADLKTVTFQPSDAGKASAFTKDSRITITKGDFSTYNVVDDLNTATNTITLRFKLQSDKFSAGDTVGAHVSAFENIRKIVSLFSLNFEELWVDKIPAPWGRALSRFLERDSWFPLGIYPLSLIAAGFNEDRLPNEQDAAYHSGDLYTSILLSRPNEIYTGQFTTIYGFLHPRANNNNGAFTLSRQGPLRFLNIELPAGVTADKVGGAVPDGVGRIRFRENYYIQMNERVENVVGVFFNTSAPGEYIPHAPGELPPDTSIVFTRFAFDVGFINERKLKVKPLEVTPETDAAHPVFETEQVLFRITGDATAEYRMAYSGAAPAPAGVINGLNFTAPNLGAAANAVHNLQITATYREDHPVFSGPGRLPGIRLTADQRTNLCSVKQGAAAPATTLAVNIQQIPAIAVGPVRAGQKVDFNTPIAARSVRITSALPAGAAIPARVVLGTGKPAKNTFFAPNKVNAPGNVDVEIKFGTAPNDKTMNFSVQVTP